MPAMTRLTLRAATLVLAGALVMPLGAGLTPAVAQPRSAPTSFADLAEKLLPGVVNISSSTLLPARGGPSQGPEIPQFPPGSPFEQFFKDFMEHQHPGGGGAPAPRRAQSLGSGFVIDPSGIIVTNNHVIEGADEITVILQDNTTLKAKLIGRDQRADLAVLKVNYDKPLPSVPWGDSDKSRVGDWVLAIGNPYGLGGTVTAGIVSARGRNIDSGPYDDFIQTDAAINKGNSGGPLFNMSGQVIGINTAIYSPSGGSIGIGFSIPSNMARNVIDQLRKYGKVRRGWLGVRIQQVTPDIAESLGLKEASGAMVAGVNDGGPADRAKVQNGDIILSFNGQPVKEMRSLPLIVAQTEIGKTVPLVVWRNGKEVTLEAVVGELPPEQKLASADTPAKPAQTETLELSGLGMKLAPITPAARDKYKLGTDQKGVLITGVESGTPAGDRGLKPGDVIVEVQQEAVNSPAEVQSRVDAVRKSNRKSVLILVQSGDGLHWIPLSLAPDKERQPG
jgi:serine protease Do